MRCGTTSTNLPSFYGNLKTIVISQGDLEAKAEDPLFRIKPFLEKGCVTPQQKVGVIKSIGVSKYGCQMLVREFYHAYNLKICDLRRNSLAFVSCDAVPVWVNKNDVVRTAVRVDIQSLLHKQQKDSIENSASCECQFLIRARKPCRHILALAMHLDKSSEFDDLLGVIDNV